MEVPHPDCHNRSARRPQNGPRACFLCPSASPFRRRASHHLGGGRAGARHTEQYPGLTLGEPGLFIDNSGATLTEAFLGFLFGFAIGIAAAIATVESRLFERTFYPIFVTSQVIPTFALAPLLVLWLGFGLEPKIVIIVLWVFFPITVNMVKGLKSADPGVIALMRSCRASRFQLLRFVQIPASLPYLFAATQLAVTYAVLGAVFVEWFGPYACVRSARVDPRARSVRGGTAGGPPCDALAAGERKVMRFPECGRGACG